MSLFQLLVSQDKKMVLPILKKKKTMEPRIETLEPTKLIGIHMKMTLSNNKTGELWQQFMPRRAEIKDRITTDFISMQTYGKDWKFSPTAIFEKWATVQVSSFDKIPPKMATYLLEGGKYAVFIHQGLASEAPKTMQYIFGQWLPESKYILSNREHFEVLPEGYSPLDPQAKEEIWVPIKDKL
jgi:AraC family transcriptional regulator